MNATALPARKPLNTIQAVNLALDDAMSVDPNVILQTSHGRRSIDVLKILSPEKANWECQSISNHR